MKRKKTIEKKIIKYQKMIDKFRASANLEKDLKNNAIKKLQFVIRELKWVLN